MSNLLQDIQNVLSANQTKHSPFDATCNLDAELRGPGRSKIHILYVARKNERYGSMEYFALVQYKRVAREMVEYVRSTPETHEDAVRLILEGVEAAVTRNDVENQEDARVERQSIVNRLAELDARVK